MLSRLVGAVFSAMTGVGPSPFDALLKRLRDNDPTLTNVAIDGRTQKLNAEASLLEPTPPLWRLCQALNNNTHVRTLDLNGHRLGPENMQVLVHMLSRNRSIRTLDLRATGLHDAAAKALAAGVRRHPVLENLYLASNSIGYSGVRALCMALAQAPALRILQLDENAPAPESIDAVIGLLQSTRSLQMLCLDQMGVRGRRVQRLAAALQTNATVRDLSLNNNPLQDADAQVIANLIEHNPRLLSLRMRGSQIGVAGGVALSRAVFHSASLVHVDVYQDPARAAQSGSRIAAADLESIERSVQRNQRAIPPDAYRTTALRPFIPAIPDPNAFFSPPPYAEGMEGGAEGVPHGPAPGEPYGVAAAQWPAPSAGIAAASAPPPGIGVGGGHAVAAPMGHPSPYSQQPQQPVRPDDAPVRAMNALELDSVLQYASARLSQEAMQSEAARLQSRLDEPGAAAGPLSESERSRLALLHLLIASPRAREYYMHLRLLLTCAHIAATSVSVRHAETLAQQRAQGHIGANDAGQINMDGEAVARVVVAAVDGSARAMSVARKGSQAMAAVVNDSHPLTLPLRLRRIAFLARSPAELAAFVDAVAMLLTLQLYAPSSDSASAASGASAASASAAASGRPAPLDIGVLSQLGRLAIGMMTVVTSPDPADSGPAYSGSLSGGERDALADAELLLQAVVDGALAREPLLPSVEATPESRAMHLAQRCAQIRFPRMQVPPLAAVAAMQAPAAAASHPGPAASAAAAAAAPPLQQRQPTPPPPFSPPRAVAPPGGLPVP